MTATPGNVIDYKSIRQRIIDLGESKQIIEIAYDRWNASQLVQDLVDDGATMVPFGQGFVSMSGPTKELLTLVLSHRIRHNGNPVLRWMSDNMVVRKDPAGNLKPDKEKSTEKIDGMVALIMALDRAIRHGGGNSSSVYEDRGIISL
jgi:phage terminase large subunit-like protein